VINIVQEDIIEQVYIFNLAPLDMQEAVFNHTILGNLSVFSENQTLAFPPKDSAFGLYWGAPDNADTKSIKANYEELTKAKLPLEGFFITEDIQEDYIDYTLDQQKIPDSNAFTQWLKENRISTIFAQSSGVPIADNGQGFFEKLKDLKCVIRNSLFEWQNVVPFIGQDKSGNVVYVDYGSHDEAPEFVRFQMDHLRKSVDFKAVALLNNEITNLYCNGYCFAQDEDVLME